ncbi:hypothetical protein Q5P01_003595 [Channa striata]|uniref:5'-(N(7)-methylguanosine 5'-triphospho)-[mRNA] hydrolase n=1 Tax=Channa striata TaxID=64152 RepID=A0AA88T2U9_CHASR|nr:hypothetical protein Q5P01_003595 [Channa striata]
MTATSAGSSSCLAAKGLDISLAALKRQDPYINNIVDVASQVALYTYNNRANEWEKTEVEGTLFIYTRLASPRHGFTIMNRLSMENLTEPITKDLDFQLQDPFLLYRNARLVIHGIWFYDKEDCKRIAQRMKMLTQQEQVLAQSQGGWLSPGGGVTGGGGSDGKAVDIIQMLTKARTEYDKEKSAPEPKEIGGSSVLYGNPNVIKPIPVKPNTQDSEGAEPKSLSLATLFGSHHSSKPEPVSPVAAPGTGSSTQKVARPPAARTLTYDNKVKGGNVAVAWCSDGGHGAHVGDDAQQQQQNHSEHCPAIQKLMQGPRGVGGVLQTVSESPENRLCDNGVLLEHHHHHHHHLYQQQHQQQQQHHHHHHHHQQQQQQLQPDPIKKLFQAPPSPSTSFSSTAPSCSSNPLSLQQNLHLSSQPIMVDSVPCSHLQAHQNQQLCFSLSKPHPEAQPSTQLALSAQGTGLLPTQVTNDQVIQPSQGLSSHIPGVMSPHELLQKLQLVQQEQNLASQDPSPLCPGLAPRFLGPTQSQGAVSVAGPVPNQTAATASQKAAMQFQVISPQRIPATVVPAQLLSPTVFSQAKSSGKLSAGAQESFSLSRPVLQEETRGLSKSQLQATLLHLIQTDSSFLDTIYEAYVSRFSNDSSSKF